MSAVLKIGESTLEVGAYGQYFVDGISHAELPATIGGFPVTNELKSENLHVFTVYMGEHHDSVVLKAYKDLVGSNLTRSTSLTAGNGHGAHYARNGKDIITDVNKFGQE